MDKERDVLPVNKAAMKDVATADLESYDDSIN